MINILVYPEVKQKEYKTIEARNMEMMSGI